MEAGSYYNLLSVVDNIRVSLANAYYLDHFIMHLHHTTAIEEQHLSGIDCNRYSYGLFVQHLSNIANSLQRISSNSIRSFTTNKLHLLDSALHVLEGNKLYEYSIHWIDLDDCDPIIWQCFYHCHSTISAILDDDSFRALATMLAALSLRYQDFWNGHFYSKATVSTTAALRGDTEFSTLSSECDNYADFSTVSVSTECENGDYSSIVSSECKNLENYTNLQAIISTIRRLKCNHRRLEKLRQVILSELQQQGCPFNDTMIEKQRNLELLLKEDKKRQQCQWLSSTRKRLAHNAFDYLAETGNVKELSHQKVKHKCLFSKGFSNAVDNSDVFLFTLFEKDDKPTRCDQCIISGNRKTIDFTGAVSNLTIEMKTKSESKLKIKDSTKLDAETNTKLGKETNTKTSIKLGSKSNTKLGSKTSATTDFTPIVMQPIFIVATTSVFTSLYHIVGEEIVLVDSFVINQDQGRQGWYK